ncbi:hypothetical protein [Nocardia sp. CA-290969]|uniref:hypothetical protein n=1 Tax=Nocardia sp. CA-290969 TaxID=3239986 RepID=UPI003D8FFA63
MVVGACNNLDPTWAQVRARPWEPFLEQRIPVDDIGDIATHPAGIRRELGAG